MSRNVSLRTLLTTIQNGAPLSQYFLKKLFADGYITRIRKYREDRRGQPKWVYSLSELGEKYLSGLPDRSQNEV